MKEFEDQIQILYRDRYLLIAVKPCGVQSEEAPEPTRGRMPDIVTLLKAQEGLADLTPLHRLDAAAGGLLMLSCDRATAGKCSAMMAEGRVEKDYLAVAHGRPADATGDLRDLLFHDSARNRTYVVDRMRRGVREARLSYEVLDSISRGEDGGDPQGGDLSLIRIRLHTGRTHQIRVQFASRKMPLLGDGRYGAKDNAKTLALWSWRLTFRHPITGKDVCVTAEPAVEPWIWFSGALDTEKGQIFDTGKGQIL